MKSPFGKNQKNGGSRSISAATSSTLLLLPAFALCMIFIFVPAMLAISGSFYSYGLTSPTREWVGLGNYIRLIQDPIFWVSLKNNMIIVLGSITLQIGIGCILAAILDRGITFGSTFFRTVIFMPVIVSAVAVAMVWLIILDPNIGMFNAVVKWMGFTPPRLGWLGDPKISIWVVLAVAAWQQTGFMMVLILAGLQGVPKERYEAAALDGARGLRAFWYITLPSIRNILIVAVLITTIGGFKVFDFVFVLTNGGPANATQVLGTYTYLQAFTLGNLGYANAIAVVLLVIAVAIGWVQLKVSRQA